MKIPKKGFVGRVYAERGGKAASPDMDVQPGRGARSFTRNLIKGVARSTSSMKGRKVKT
jgi:hypothetical protein